MSIVNNSKHKLNDVDQLWCAMMEWFYKKVINFIWVIWYLGYRFEFMHIQRKNNPFQGPSYDRYNQLRQQL